MQEKQVSTPDMSPKEAMKKSLEAVKDPALKNLLSGIMERVQKAGPIDEIVEIKRRVAKLPKKEEQLVLAFMPHEMAKVSIFFPMSDKELKEENRKISHAEYESNWGKVGIEGIKLAIFEEDIFLAIIKLAREKKSFTGTGCMLETTMKEIIHLLYGTSGYNPQRTTDRILKTLDHFQLVNFSIILFVKSLKGKKETKKDGFRGSIGNIIQSHYYNPKTQNLKIFFNPHFCMMFMESMLTRINFTLRRQLKKDGSKALLRFLAAHNRPDKMHMLTVLKAINYNIEQPMYELRRKMKNFIAELKRNGVLGKKTKLEKNDIVFFDVLPINKTLLKG